jgi:NADPH:quinone reductase-like Zn-dependent oxidoreductase
MAKLPKTMTAVLLTRHGGFDAMEYSHNVAVPEPGPGEVLIRVAAAGVNNTDINTRIGWYSKTIRDETNAHGATGSSETNPDDASWSGTPLRFPFIQGADCCGTIVAVGSGVSDKRIGERVIVRNMLRAYVDYEPFECWTLGSECDGGFAQFTKAPSRETYAVNTTLSDLELAAIPCAFSTAEGMLHRAAVKKGESVLITGASGGVGMASVQLARCRQAEIVAIAAPDKADAVKKAGASRVVSRGADLVRELGRESFDVVIDVVAGPQWGPLLELLKKGGRYAVAGAIAGPIVELDVRTLYLKDLTFFGCTFQEDAVFENLVRLVERGEVKPLIAKSYPLAEIAEAQKDFLSKKFAGKLVLVPPPVS